uniref:Uncharacterized protein n=1 Tax=Serinus canaria TaxID=9135 RepID=A0A8C9NQQ8_SERCA
MYNVLCRNNDKFPSSSTVNCCTDVTFSRVSLYQCLKYLSLTIATALLKTLFSPYQLQPE